MDNNSNLEIADTQNLEKKSLLYSFLNILSISQLAGIGIRYELSEDDILKFVKKLDKPKKNTLDIKEVYEHDINSKKECMKEFEFLYDFKPVSAVFSKGVISSTDEKLINNAKQNINHDKIISPKNQGLLMLNEIKMAKYLYDNSITIYKAASTESEQLLGMILLDSAIKQGEYCFDNLKTEEGFFIEKSFKIQPYEKDSIFDNLFDENEETKSNDYNWENQVYMLWAYYELQKLLGDKNFERYYNKEKAESFKENALNIIHNIISNEESIINLETSKLSSIFSPLVYVLKNFDSNTNYKYFILSISDELYSREFDTGYIYSDKNKSKAASLATHFKTIEALIDAYISTEFDCFLYLSERIFKNLNWFWDSDLCLFKLDNDKSIKYTTKTISYIIKSLTRLLNTTKSESIKRKIEKQLNEFFESSIIKSGLQDEHPLISNNNLLKSTESLDIKNLTKDALSYLMKNGFKINPKNNSLSLYGKNVLSEYVLLVSNALLELAFDSEQMHHQS